MIKIYNGEYHVKGSNLEVALELSMLFSDLLKNSPELLLSTVLAYEHEMLASKAKAKDMAVATTVAKHVKWALEDD